MSSEVCEYQTYSKDTKYVIAQRLALLEAKLTFTGIKYIFYSKLLVDRVEQDSSVFKEKCKKLTKILDLYNR